MTAPILTLQRTPSTALTKRLKRVTLVPLKNFWDEISPNGLRHRLDHAKRRLGSCGDSCKKKFPPFFSPDLRPPWGTLNFAQIHRFLDFDAAKMHHTQTQKITLSNFFQCVKGLRSRMTLILFLIDNLGDFKAKNKKIISKKLFKKIWGGEKLLSARFQKVFFWRILLSHGQLFPKKRVSTFSSFHEDQDVLWR